MELEVAHEDRSNVTVAIERRKMLWNVRRIKMYMSAERCPSKSGSPHGVSISLAAERPILSLSHSNTHD